MLKRLTNKKGFTLVELVVVIAIMLIMGTIVTVAISTGSTQREADSSKAKSFYYNIQEIMAEQKFKDDFVIPNGQSAILCVSRSTTSGDVVCAYNISSNPKGSTLSDYITESGSPEIYTTLDSLLKDFEGGFYLYASVDSQYRVTSVCVTTATFDELKATSFVTSGDNSIAGKGIAAYPKTNSLSGATVL